MATVTRYRFSTQELRTLTGWPQRVVDDYTQAQDEAVGFEEEIETIQFEIDQLQSDVLDINNEINTINTTIDAIQVEVDQNASDIQQNTDAIADLESGEDASIALLLARKALSLFDSITENEMEDPRIQVLFQLLEGVKDSSEDNAALAAMVASQQKRISILEDLVASLV
jgi:septal ring factor EnvC (AmiA/AmiB activator)